MEGARLNTGLCGCHCGFWPGLLSLSQPEPEPRLFPAQRPMNCARNKGLCGRKGEAGGEERRGPLTSSGHPETKAQEVQAEG